MVQSSKKLGGATKTENMRFWGLELSLQNAKTKPPPHHHTTIAADSVCRLRRDGLLLDAPRGPASLPARPRPGRDGAGRAAVPAPAAAHEHDVGERAVRAQKPFGSGGTLCNLVCLPRPCPSSTHGGGSTPHIFSQGGVCSGQRNAEDRKEGWRVGAF